MRSSKFDLDKAISVWRRGFQYKRAILPDDLDELEQHIRDQVSALVAEGLGEEEAYRQTLREMGDDGTAEAEYRKVYWSKLKRRHELLNECLYRLSMFNNYLKVAFRNLLRQKSFSLINIFGLALSMSVCLLILTLIHNQRSYDRFHEHSHHIYRVIADRIDPGNNITTTAATPAFLAPAIERDVPGIERTVRLGKLSTNALHEGKSLHVNGLYTEPTFFDIFDFELIAGAPEHALTGPHSLVLSEETAVRVFGDHNPIGEIITLEGTGDFTVTGIVRTQHLKSHLKFDLLASFSTLETLEQGREHLSQVDNFYSFATYLLLDKEETPQRLSTYLNQVSQRYESDTFRYHMKLQPLTGISLGPLVRNEISSFSLPFVGILFLAGLGLVIMIAAGFNYIGLSVARSLNRSREIGIRKTVGAQRHQLVFQFLVESVLTAFVALGVAYILLIWLLPGFNNLALVQKLGAQLTPQSLYDPALFGLFIGFGIIIGLLAGAYPAIHLSKLRTAMVVKGKVHRGSRSRLTVRKSLVVLQLSFSLLFIISTTLLYRQFSFIMDYDYGFQTTDLISIDLQGNSYPILRDKLLQHPGVLNVSASSAIPASPNSRTLTSLVRSGNPDTLTTTLYRIDPHFVETIGLELLAGRDFSQDYSGVQEGVLLNETAVRRLGFAILQDAIDETVSINDEPQSILGVIRDYQFNSVLRLVEPLVLYREPEEYKYATVRVQSELMQDEVAFFHSIWEKLDPIHPLEYTFLDVYLQEQEDIRYFRDFLQVIGLTVLITLTIACLGLLSMAVYSAQMRTKEIGIRKVFGASVPSLAWLLSREFAVLLLMAFILASPLAWFVNNIWLQWIANRIPFGFSIFAFGILILMVLGMLAVGSQTIRTAFVNPVENLRNE